VRVAAPPRAPITALGGIAALLCAPAIGCGPASWGEATPLATPDAWRAWDGDDPFGEPDERYCDPLAWGLEDLGETLTLQIYTTGCPWVTVFQVTLQEVRPRDRIAVRVFHDPLLGPSGSEARLGLWLDGDVIWEDAARIPGPSGVLSGEVAVDRRVPAGSPILFHVDNHGTNSYHLYEIGLKLPD
jgi:hypothetical protein